MGEKGDNIWHEKQKVVPTLVVGVTSATTELLPDELLL